MTRLPMVAVVLVLVAELASAGAASAGVTDLRVSTHPTAVATSIGRKFILRTTISNDGQAPARKLIAHLNVLSVRPGVYVDPEDWSSQRTRYLRPIPAGGSQTVGWILQAVNAGDFAVYVAVLSNDGRTLLATSPPLRLEVGDRRTLDGGGVLPLVIGMPAALGLAWIGVRARRRRAGQVTRSETNSPAVTRP